MSYLEITVLILLVLGVLGALVYLRTREEKYLKKKTSETFSKQVREEIEAERAENIRKKEKFREALKKFDLE